MIAGEFNQNFGRNVMLTEFVAGIGALGDVQVVRNLLLCYFLILPKGFDSVEYHAAHRFVNESATKLL